jgi:chemotaxis family two-component system response regulator Rcp1
MSAKRSNAAWSESVRELFILHVEDNPDDRILFQMAGEQTRNPIAWQTADSTEQAISYLNNLESRAGHQRVRWPDLMLLDIVMPRESGTKVLQFLIRNPAIKRFPVIVLTGSEDAKVDSEARKLGAQSVCVKPQSFEHLAVFMDSLYRSWSRTRVDSEPEAHVTKKFRALYFSTAPERDHAAFRTGRDEASADIIWQKFDSLHSAWSHLQMLMRLKYMKAVDWPDLALLDLSTNDDAGWQLLRLIRSAPEFHGLPVIAFTPVGDRKSAVRANELGANSLAGIPLDFRQEIQLIKVLNASWTTTAQHTRIDFRTG